MIEVVKVEKTAENWLNGNTVKEQNITELIIKTEPIPEESEYEGKVSTKLTCDVVANNNTYRWSMNNTTKNVLIEKFEGETAKWIGMEIPIETAPSSNGKRAIFADKAKLLGKL